MVRARVIGDCKSRRRPGAGHGRGPGSLPGPGWDLTVSRTLRRQRQRHPVSDRTLTRRPPHQARARRVLP
eukprot:702335-Hanusia_phi.AAC.1